MFWNFYFLENCYCFLSEICIVLFLRDLTEAVSSTQKFKEILFDISWHFFGIDIEKWVKYMAFQHF